MHIWVDKLDGSGCMGGVYKTLRVGGGSGKMSAAKGGEVLGVVGIRIRERERDRAGARGK